MITGVGSRLTGRVARIPVLFLILILAACSSESVMQPVEMTPDLERDLSLISHYRIYFGHQSVGDNVIDGLTTLQGKHPVLNIGTLGELSLPENGGVLLHTPIGENEQPISKCEDFRRILSQDLKGRVDVALVKFCYVDFNENTDVASVFDRYQAMIGGLKEINPGTVFVHVTVPLRHTDSGLGVWLREMLRRPNRSKLANIGRNEFNRLLRETFAHEPIYDLAAVESTYPDGRRETFSYKGKRYESLIGGYTDDGGHLNATGRSRAAAAFVRILADAVPSTASQTVTD